MEPICFSISCFSLLAYGTNCECDEYNINYAQLVHKNILLQFNQLSLWKVWF